MVARAVEAEVGLQAAAWVVALLVESTVEEMVAEASKAASEASCNHATTREPHKLAVGVKVVASRAAVKAAAEEVVKVAASRAPVVTEELSAVMEVVA